jgi:hypothetical protein
MPEPRRGNVRNVVLYDDVVQTAHTEEHALRRVESEIIRFEHTSNGGQADLIVVIKATVETSRGTFTAHGSATLSEASGVSGRWIELGDTRAIKRALILATGTRAGESQDDRPRGRAPTHQGAQVARPHTVATPGGGDPMPALTNDQFNAIAHLLNITVSSVDWKIKVWRWIEESTEKKAQEVSVEDGGRLIQELNRRARATNGG